MDTERFARAVALRDGGKEEDALREFEALASRATDAFYKGSLLLNQANCLWRLGRLEEAREQWSQATAIWRTPFTEFLDACMCVTEGKSEEAVDKLMVFLKSHIDLKESEHQKVYFDAQDELGQLLFNLGRYAEAVDPLEGALTIAEGDHRKTLCYYLGVCHYTTGKLEVAESELIQSLPENRHDPWWVHAQYHLGCSYFQRRAYLEARQAFELCDFFMDDADTEMKQNVSMWLAAIHRELGLGDKSVH